MSYGYLTLEFLQFLVSTINRKMSIFLSYKWPGVPCNPSLVISPYNWCFPPSHRVICFSDPRPRVANSKFGSLYQTWWISTHLPPQWKVQPPSPTRDKTINIYDININVLYNLYYEYIYMYYVYISKYTSYRYVYLHIKDAINHCYGASTR